MSTPNKKPYNSIKEKKTHEHTFQIIKGEKQNKHTKQQTLKFEKKRKEKINDLTGLGG